MPTHADYDKYLQKLRKWIKRTDTRLDGLAETAEQDRLAIRDEFKSMRQRIKALEDRVTALEGP